MGDALGSVRQLTDPTGAVTLAQSYAPYGETIQTTGTAQTIYQFTGEMRDSTGLTYLRARYLDTSVGRFITRDTWGGDHQIPMSYNAWLYGYGNPIKYRDPSGLISKDEVEDAERIVNILLALYNIRIHRDWGQIVPEPIPIPEPPGQRETVSPCFWESGNWHSIHELELTLSAFNTIATKIGGVKKFRSAMNGRLVSVVRCKELPWGAAGMAPPIIGVLTGDILLAEYVFSGPDIRAKHYIAHEFAHVWDWRTWGCLSRGLQNFIGTTNCQQGGAGGRSVCWFDIKAGKEVPPGDRNKPYAGAYRIEDWAESFAYYVYPSYGNLYPRYNPIGPLRRQYVSDQINDIP